MEKKNDYTSNFIKAKTTEIFKFLEQDFGYDLSIENGTSKIYAEVVNFIYSSSNRCRNVTVYYSRKEKEETTRHNFMINIVRTPYKTIEDFFSLNVYLNTIGKDLNSELNHFDELHISKVLEELANSLRTYALQIVGGSKWDTRYYPRRD